ncbi:RHS repeat domain-containing protein [Mixta intestinalis]|uniref:Deoxyribonuclease RhsC n=1 Tax=Mixta intestinalis TaxID=1615494 RepID=A0A6P1Q3Q8_9GAMM|nr:RHS repeat domain-containing protein [Mixta intestinalis]QHM72689.1 Putative deoxyribonuclease RhsC [Mixta intestinalis]
MNTALFRNTPSVTVFDNRGLTIRDIAYHRHPGTQDVTTERITRHRYNAHGFLTQSADPRLHDARLANFTYLTDLAGNTLRTQGVDNGTFVSLNDAAGRPFITISNISTANNGTEDRSQAVTRTWQYENAKLPGRLMSVTEQVTGGIARITERFVYAGNSDVEKAMNLAGQCISHYDTAGLLQTDSVALTGVPLSVTRRLLKDADNPDVVADWQGDAATWNDMLDSEEYATLTTADATGAVLTTTDAKGNMQRVVYDVAGLLSGSWLTLKGGKEQTIVTSLTYSAMGQKLREVHGNGVVTTYTYEAETQRLTGIKTERPDGNASGAKVLQDLRYEYDPVGNVLNVSNDAEETRFWHNQKIVPKNTYTYDSLYQLVSATGREMANAGQQGNNLPSATVPLPTDNSTYTNYTRTYTYDEAGNLTQARHTPATGSGYSTKITVSDRSNRGVLSTLTENSADVDALFTAGGQQMQLQPGQHLVWTARNELLKITPVVRDGSTDDSESYRYDTGSQRILKVCTQRTGNSVQTQRVLYLPGLELRSTKAGNTETESLQVITVGEAGRAQVRVLHWESGKPTEITGDQLRYSYDNLTGSSSLELDGDGNVISAEEYYPYGGTAVWTARSAVEADYKAVRYSGKERDATGLYYYGYRYYQPWAGRWISSDPAGTADGLNLFSMVRNNPVTFSDNQGLYSILDILNIDKPDYSAIDSISTKYARGYMEISNNDFLTLSKKNSKKKDLGSHENRNNEAVRLGLKNKKDASGKAMYTSEHAILHSVTAAGAGRGDISGNTKVPPSAINTIPELEKRGYAYQEYDLYHHAHVGSNNNRSNYKEYYNLQRGLLKEGNPAAAIQINQLYYAHSSTFRKGMGNEGSNSNSEHNSAARNSLIGTILSKGTMYWAIEGNEKIAASELLPIERIEIILSRVMSELGRIPTNRELNTVIDSYNAFFSSPQAKKYSAMPRLEIPDGYLPYLKMSGYEDKTIFGTEVIMPVKQKNLTRRLSV